MVFHVIIVKQLFKPLPRYYKDNCLYHGSKASPSRVSLSLFPPSIRDLISVVFRGFYWFSPALEMNFGCAKDNFHKLKQFLSRAPKGPQTVGCLIIVVTWCVDDFY